MALFKILKGNEANLPSTKHEGWAYVTEKGNMYVDLSNDKRVKIGNRADTAEYADKATGDTQTIRSRYLARIKQVTSDGTQFTFRGETGDGTNAPDLISIPLAGDKAGLVSNAAQTIKGEKTFANGIKFPDVTSTTYPAVSAGLTWSGSTDGAKIYYEVQASDKGMLIIEARDDTNAGAIFRNSNSKKEVSIINGLVTGEFKGNLSGTASHATSDANGKNIASYVASVLAQSDNRTIRVTKGDGTTNDVKLYFAASSSFGGAADSANVLNINNTENIGVGRMQFFQKSGDATLMPDTNWWSLVRLQHGGYASTGYWTEMAYAFHSDTIKFRRNQNGTKSAWKTIAFTDGTIAKATQAEKDWLGQVIDETYMKYPLSISGEVITMTRGDGVSSTITVPDTKVTQSETTTANYRPIILGYTNTTDTTKLSASTRNQVYASNKFYAQPSTGLLVATTFKGALDGNAKTATNAEFAEKAKGDTQSIQSKYVSSVLKKSGSNYVLRVTKGDGTYNDVDLYFAASASCGGAANSANAVNVQDVRGANNLPNASIYNDKQVKFIFNNTGMPSSAWYSGLHISGWTKNDYQTWELVSGSTTSLNGKLYYRNGIGGTWQAWKELVFTDGTVQNAQYAEKDKEGNIIADTYIATLKQVTSNGTTFTFRGVSGGGDDRPDLITIPVATASKAGLVTNAAQTWAGKKTFTGDIVISHDCVNTMTNTSTNPQIKLGNADLSQYAIMMYTSYDTYRAPGGIKVLGPSTTDPIWFEVEGDLYVGRNLYDKEKNVLLASKYVASISGSQGDTNYTITPKNQEGTTLSSVLNVPINLVGSGNTSSKIFLVGTTSQNAKAQTGYSHDTVYIDTDGFLYDSGNKPSYHSKATVGNTNNYKYHRIARTNEITSSWHDGTILLYISQDYNGGRYGLLRLSLRTNDISTTANASVEAEWLVRSGFELSDFKIALYSAAKKVYADLYYVSNSTYASITVKQIQQGSRGSLNQSRWYLTSSSEVNDTTTSDKKTSTSYKDITAAQTGLRGGVAYTSTSNTVDASRVNNANYADRAQYDWNGNDIRKKYIATLAVKTTNGTTFTFKGSSMEGDELSAITVPAATASVAGLVTNGAQTWAGNKTLNNDLYVKGKVAVSATSANGYNLYVNGTSYFVSDARFKTEVYLEAKGANRLLYSDGNKKIMTGSHYANSTQVGINTTNTTNISSYNLFVEGTARFGIGADDVVASKKFVIGSPGNRYLSFGGSGVQAYDASDKASIFYINYNGGNFQVGSSASLFSLFTLWGGLTIKGTTSTMGSVGFNYEGIGAASDNVHRVIWFAYNGRNGTPVYDNDFTYNPSTDELKVKKILISDTTSGNYIKFARNSYGYILGGGADGTISINPSGNNGSAYSVLTVGQKSVFSDMGDAAVDLGRSDKYWKNLYINNIYIKGTTKWRLMWVDGDGLVKSANHFANESKVGINLTSEPGYTFYVNGTSYFNGNTIIKGHLTPDSDSAYDIGSTSKHWRYGYYDGMFISADTGFTATAGNQGKAGTYAGPGYFEMTASTPYIDFHNANSTSDFSARIISDGANRLSIKQGGTPVSLTYNTRAITPLLQVNGILYGSSAIESAEYFLNNRASAGGGFYVYGNAKQYGRFYMQTVGTTSAVGITQLEVGNSTASGTANNSRGRVYVYGQTSSLKLQLDATTYGNIYLYKADGQNYYKDAAGTTATNYWHIYNSSGQHLFFRTYYGGSTTAASSFRYISMFQNGGLALNSTSQSVTPTGGSATTFMLYVNGSSYTAGNIWSTASIIMNRSGTGHGFILRNQNKQYAFLGVDTVGTVATASAAGTAGVATLYLGNSTAQPAAGDTTSGANNAYGRILLYGTNANYTIIRAQANGNRTFYLPNYAGTMYAVHAGNNNAVGASGTPVYVAANGRVTACGELSVVSAGARYLKANQTAPAYDHCLTYFSGQIALGTAAGNAYSGTSSNRNLWSFPAGQADENGSVANVQVLRMSWGTTYWHEIFANPNRDQLWHRSVRAGTAYAWKKIWIEGNSVTSAVWNDYAECRKADSQEPGYVMFEKGDDSLSKTIERLQHFAGIVSDTWGFSQGETADAKTNIAVAGRVLAYPYRDRNEYKPGDCVCAAPGGKVDIMTREEVAQYPDRIVGTVSCVPEYEEWGGGEGADRDPVKVNGRIWIKVK